MNEKENVFKNIKLPVLDINGEWKIFNPYKAISLSNHYDYKDIICLRFNDRDIFYNIEENKHIEPFFEITRKNPVSIYEPEKPWTNANPFPECYNRYKLNLKCIVFDYYMYQMVNDFCANEMSAKNELANYNVRYQLITKAGVSEMFWNCQNIPNDLPEYFRVTSNVPNTINCLFPIPIETANLINNYML